MNLGFKRRLDTIVGVQLIFFTLIISRIVGLFRRKKSSISLPPPNEIIFIKLLGLGSVILALDSIYALKVKYPNAKLTMLCSPSMKAGLERLYIFNEVLIIEDKSFVNLLTSSLKVLWYCWKRKNIWIIDLEVYSKLTTIFSYWTGAEKRFGFYLNLVTFRNVLYTHLCFFNHFKAVRENYMRLARTAGAEDSGYYEIPKLESNNRGNEIEKSYIAINNTCSDLSVERKLPTALLQKLVGWLLENTDKKIALTGAPSDFKENQETIHFFSNHPEQPRVENIAGKYKLPEYYEFLHKECMLMLSIDSFPLHISRTLGLPTLSIWGPTNPDHYLSDLEGKYNPDRHIKHYLFVHCSPCVHHTDVLPCKGNNICILKMKQGEITEKIDLLLQKTGYAKRSISKI